MCQAEQLTRGTCPTATTLLCRAAGATGLQALDPALLWLPLTLALAQQAQLPAARPAPPPAVHVRRRL